MLTFYKRDLDLISFPSNNQWPKPMSTIFGFKTRLSKRCATSANLRVLIDYYEFTLFLFFK